MDSYMTSDDLRKLVRTRISQRVRGGDLEVPMLPHIAQEVLSLTSHPDVAAQDFVTLIEKDQQLSGRLLKIANSPVYAGRVKITSIQRAVVTIGMRTLRELVFSIAVGERIFRSKLFNEPMRRVWDHSVAVAHIAKEVALIKSIDAEYAFLCGLLHDCGKPLLLEVLERISKEHKERVYFSNQVVDDTLREYHAEVGGLVARAWRFSDLLYGAIRFHHQYDEADSARQMALLVQVANLLAHTLGLGSYAEEEEIDIMREKALYDLNLYPDEIQALLKNLPKTTRALVAEFQV